MTEEDKKKIAAIMEKHGVVVGYLFGSAVRDRMGQYSDIDVAVLFDENAVPADRQFKEKLAISREVTIGLNVPDADVIVLNGQTNPVILHESVLNGEVILVRDNDAKIRLALYALRQYEDTRYLREIAYRILREQAKSGVFGRASTR